MDYNMLIYFELNEYEENDFISNSDRAQDNEIYELIS